MKLATKLWIFIAVLALLSPLGLYLPQLARSGPAWGEWSAGEVGQMEGAVPHGLARFEGIWKALLPDYMVRGWEEKGLRYESLAYIVSAAAGIIATVAAVFAIVALCRKRRA